MPFLSVIAARLGIPPPPGEDREIKGVLPLGDAGPEEISFCHHSRYREDLRKTHAGVVLVPPSYVEDVPPCTQAWVVDDPYALLPELLQIFAPSFPLPTSIDPQARIHPRARIGSETVVGPFSVIEEAVIGSKCTIMSHVFIGQGVEIGDGSLIYPGVKIMPYCKIGRRVILHSGVVIGSDGFGFVSGSQGIRKIPQIGIVVIEDDVEIGANTTVDRATLGVTRIGKGVKLDNLVQVGHNVEIGDFTVIAAQTGIAGSTKIGPFCRIGGQVGIAGHLRVGARVEIAAKTGVMRDVPDGERIAGIPQQKFFRWLRTVAILEKLPEWFQQGKIVLPRSRHRHNLE